MKAERLKRAYHLCRRYFRENGATCKSEPGSHSETCLSVFVYPPFSTECADIATRWEGSEAKRAEDEKTKAEEQSQLDSARSFIAETLRELKEQPTPP